MCPYNESGASDTEKHRTQQILPDTRSSHLKSSSQRQWWQSGSQTAPSNLSQGVNSTGYNVKGYSSSVTLADHARKLFGWWFQLLSSDLVFLPLEEFCRPADSLLINSVSASIFQGKFHLLATKIPYWNGNNMGNLTGEEVLGGIDAQYGYCEQLNTKRI